MVKAAAGKRIVLQLDSRVAFEALILNRLERIPEGRRQEWLRGLLVQGFSQECQSLRVLQDEIEPRSIAPTHARVVSAKQPQTAFAAWLAKPVSRADVAVTPVPVVAKERTPAGQGKPFAGLRKVIG